MCHVIPPKVTSQTSHRFYTTKDLTMTTTPQSFFRDSALAVEQGIREACIAPKADFSVTVHVEQPPGSSTIDFHYDLESLEEGLVVEFMQPSGKIPLIKDCLDQLQDDFEQDLNAMLVQ